MVNLGFRSTRRRAVEQNRRTRQRRGRHIEFGLPHRSVTIRAARGVLWQRTGHGTETSIQLFAAGGRAMADLEARVKELEAKVLELTDREAIRDLRYRYHEYVNEGKFKDIPDLFTED